MNASKIMAGIAFAAVLLSFGYFFSEWQHEKRKNKELQEKLQTQKHSSPTLPQAVDQQNSFTQIERTDKIAQEESPQNREANRLLRALENRKQEIKQAPSIGEVEELNDEWGFVVLNVGSNRELTRGVELAIRRDSFIIGRVVVEKVEPSSSIANIIPGTTPNEFTIQKGDSAIIPIEISQELRDFQSLLKKLPEEVSSSTQ